MDEVTNNNVEYVYFLYSHEQYKEKNNILNKTGKMFEVGTVVVGGSRRSFTQLSTTKTIPRYIDTIVVAEGPRSQFVYTEPKTIKRRDGEFV